MKKIPVAVLNGIVAFICAIALIGYFLFPLWTIKTNVVFNEDVAELLLDNMGETSSEESSGEKDIVPILIEELGEERISLDISVSIETGMLMSCALTTDTAKVEKFIHNLIDDLVKSVDQATLERIEDSIARASVTSAVKMELQKLSEDLGEDVEQLMNELDIDEKYLDDKTNLLLDAVRADDATVDSVTDVVMGVVDDLYSKLENTYPHDYEPLTPSEEQELRSEIESIIGELADEEGNIDGDGLLSALLAGLLEGESLPEELDEELGYAPQNTNFAISNYFYPESSSESAPSTQKPLDQVLADTLKDSITSDTLNTVRIIAIVLFAFVFLSAFWWLYLIIKILAKIGMRNPLVSVKAPIITGWIPFVVLVLIPSIAISKLSHPTGAFANALGSEGVAIMEKLFNGAISINFTSSSLISLICAIVLFVFGFFYSSRRREFKRKIKQEKRAFRQNGGLY